MKRAGLPVVCMDARRAADAVRSRPEKTDKADARSLAEMLACGWYGEVYVKSLDSHRHKVLLGARDQLVRVKRQLYGQVRGLLRPFGIRIFQRAGAKRFDEEARAACQADDKTSAARVVRGQDPVRRRLRRKVRQPVTKPASRTKFLTVPLRGRPDTIVSDNIQFADLPKNRYGPTARWRGHPFDRTCQSYGIEHRLTKPNHPWTNGQVERMNRTIKEATVKRYHYDSHDQLRRHLADFLAAYNFTRRLKTLDGLTPYEYICKVWTSEPDRFILDPIHQMPGLNI